MEKRICYIRLGNNYSSIEYKMKCNISLKAINSKTDIVEKEYETTSH
jgi:hypothetical protein